MKREEVLALFPDATDEQLDKLMNINGSDINKAKAKVAAEQAEIERLKEVERQFEETKNASLTAEEKHQKALQSMAEQSKKLAFELNKTKAEATLLGYGMQKENIQSILDGIVHEDTEKTVALAISLGELFKSQIDITRESTKKQTQADILNATPSPTGGNGTPATVTKEQFKEMTYQQMAELKTTNPTLFTQLNS